MNQEALKSLLINLHNLRNLWTLFFAFFTLCYVLTAAEASGTLANSENSDFLPTTVQLPL